MGKPRGEPLQQPLRRIGGGREPAVQIAATRTATCRGVRDSLSPLFFLRRREGVAPHRERGAFASRACRMEQGRTLAGFYFSRAGTVGKRALRGSVRLVPSPLAGNKGRRPLRTPFFTGAGIRAVGQSSAARGNRIDESLAIAAADPALPPDFAASDARAASPACLLVPRDPDLRHPPQQARFRGRNHGDNCPGRA